MYLDTTGIDIKWVSEMFAYTFALVLLSLQPIVVLSLSMDYYTPYPLWYIPTPIIHYFYSFDVGEYIFFKKHYIDEKDANFLK